MGKIAKVVGEEPAQVVVGAVEAGVVCPPRCKQRVSWMKTQSGLQSTERGLPFSI